MRPEKHSLKFHGYELSYYLEPGAWMSPEELLRLQRSLEYVNRASGRNLNYGVFDPKNGPAEVREFFSKANTCVITWAGEPVGFFFNLVLRGAPDPALHAGLVMINRNTGVDLLTVPYAYLNMLQYRRYGAYHYTNISSTPSIIGVFTETYSNVWPSHRSNMVKPPSSKYREVLKLLFEEYIERYFPEDQVEVDTRRFVMRSPSSQMGFETNLKKLSRFKQLPVNLFCSFWIDYSAGEDLIQVGKVDFKFYLKGLALLALDRVNGLFKGVAASSSAKDKFPAVLKSARSLQPVVHQQPAAAVAPLSEAPRPTLVASQ